MQNKAPANRRTWPKVLLGVSILGMAAYVLFTYLGSQPEAVRARQTLDSTVPTPVDASAKGSVSVTQAIVPKAGNDSGTAAPVESDPANLKSLSHLTEALATLPSDQKATANKLLQFATTGQTSGINDVTHEQVEALGRQLLQTLGTDAVASLLESELHLPAPLFLDQPDPAAALADLFDAMKGSNNAPTQQTLIFTDNCETDGTVTGNVHVIPAGTHRVYAAFENGGGLHGLDRVLAVWRDPNDEKMVFTEYEPVKVGSTYNYVWLELRDGWPTGYYQLDLYHPQQTTQLLASRGFNVR